MGMKLINSIVLHWALSASDVDTNETGKIDFAVGGQAVIEGVMMRSPNSVTIAVRKPDGSMKIKEDHYQTFIQKHPSFNVPILRGVIGLLEMMVIGTKAINFSANESLEEPETSVKKSKKTDSEKNGAFETAMFILSLIVAMGFSLLLFKFIPLGITSFLENHVPYVQDHWFIFNIIDGTLKASIFLAYVWILSVIPSFRRIFEYHGAEHKSIFTYENNLPLEVEHAKDQIRFHPRCGTSFIIIVFLLSIIFYSFIPKQETFLLNFGLRTLLLPIVGGLSYEILKISAKNIDTKLVKALVSPGLAFQRITTKEPDAGQLETGLGALKAALAIEDSKK